MTQRYSNPARFTLAIVAFCAAITAPKASAQQIASMVNVDGRRLFVNYDPPAPAKLTATRKAPTNIYLNSEASFTGFNRPAVSIDRDGVEKLVREAAERHRVDPALVRAVIQAESNWNPKAYSRKGAGGLMQLIPTTAQRYGANDVFNPQQNIDAGVRYLRTLLERYNGSLDLALAAYNAGEGAVDRAHGVPSFRETRNYVQKVQDVYFSPNSGRAPGAFINARAIRRETGSDGRTVFSND
jgi:soluble lytic murein transglycosylase-like protein